MGGHPADVREKMLIGEPLRQIGLLRRIEPVMAADARIRVVGMAVSGHIAQLVAQPYALRRPDTVGQHGRLGRIFPGGKDVAVIPKGAY